MSMPSTNSRNPGNHQKTTRHEHQQPTKRGVFGWRLCSDSTGRTYSDLSERTRTRMQECVLRHLEAGSSQSALSVWWPNIVSRICPAIKELHSPGASTICLHQASEVHQLVIKFLTACIILDPKRKLLLMPDTQLGEIEVVKG